MEGGTGCSPTSLEPPDCQEHPGKRAKSAGSSLTSLASEGLGVAIVQLVFHLVLAWLDLGCCNQNAV